MSTYPSAPTLASYGWADNMLGRDDWLKANKADLSGATFTGDVNAALVDGGGQVYNVLHPTYGAKGDGSTDDATAINAAITAAKNAGGGVVYLPYTTNGYAASAIVLAANVTLRGDKRVLLKRTGTATSYFVNFPAAATFAGIESVTLDGNGLCNSAILNITGGASHIGIKDVALQSSAAFTGTVYAVQLLSTCSNVLVDGCLFTDLVDNLRIAGQVTSSTVSNSTWTGWGDYAIFVIGTASAATSDLSIKGNRITSVSTTYGDPRQPLAIQGVSGAYHNRVSVTDNWFVGNGLAHHQGNDGGTLLGGTADQISLQYCQDSVIANNHVIDGGEAGVTISQTSRRVVVNGNTIKGQNTVAVALGASGTDVYDISVTGNVIADNGHELSPPDTGDRAGVHSAVWCSSAHGVVVEGNSISDDQDTVTQKYVIYGTSSDGLRVGMNTQRNLVATLDTGSASNTDATMVSTETLS